MKKKYIDKKLREYVKTNVDKGYSLDNIKKGLIRYGYDPLFSEKLINSYIIKNHVYRYMAVILLIAIFSVSLIKPTITGYTILTKYTDYVDNINLMVNKSSEYTWNVKNKGDIDSIKASGSVTGHGYAKIYIENNNEKYLVYDSKKDVTECTFIDLVYSLFYFKGNETRCVSYKKLYSGLYSSLRKIILKNEPAINFKEICAETCSLTDFQKDSYKLIFELKNAELRLDKIHYTIKISYENNPPNSTIIPDIEWDEDNIYKLNLSKYFFDIDDDISDYISTKPEDIDVVIDKKTGIAILIPKKDRYGSSSVVFSAIDAGGLTAISNKVTLTVKNINDMPVITDISLLSTDELKRTNGNLIANYTSYDADNDAIKAEILWYKNNEELTSLANKTSVSSEDTKKGEEWFFNIRVYDGLNWSSVIKSNKIKIENTAPKIALIGDKTAINNEEFVFNALASDNDVNDKTDILTWYINDTMLDIDLLTGLITDIPKESEAGIYNILINVSDGTASDEQVFTYIIKDTTAPRWSESKTSKQLIRVNNNITFSTKWTDTYLDYYFFSTDDSGKWINYSSEYFNITTNISAAAKTVVSTRDLVVSWKFYAKDKSGNTGETKTHEFTVANTDPVLYYKIPDIAWYEDRDYLNKIDLDDYFFDADDDRLEFSVTGNSIIDIVIDENNKVSFTQLNDWYGNESIIFTASDGITAVKSNNITLRVRNVHDCGKDGCEPGESCITCPVDCGECAAVNETVPTEEVSVEEEVEKVENVSTEEKIETNVSYEPKNITETEEEVKVNVTKNITIEKNITAVIYEWDGFGEELWGDEEEEEEKKEEDIPEEQPATEAEVATAYVKPSKPGAPPELEEQLIEIHPKLQISLEPSGGKREITEKIGTTSISPSQIKINPVPCVRSTRIVEKEELSFEELNATMSIKVPKGYDIIIPPFKIKCEGELLFPTVSIPENYERVRVLKCKEAECYPTKVVEVSELKCGEELREVYREEKYLKPKFMTIKIEETSLNLSSFEEALESSSNKVRFYGEAFENISATLSMPKEEIAEPENPSLKIIGTPLMLKVEKKGEKQLSSTISMPYVEEKDIDESTIAMYVRTSNKWKYLGGTLDKQSRIVTADVANIIGYLDANNEAQFALMGIICVNCLSSGFTKVYEPTPNIRDAVIFVHGLMSSPRTYQNIINDIRLMNQPWQVWTFGYPTDREIEINAKELSDHLQANVNKYDNIYIVAHSLGGLIAQQALYNAYSENKKDPKKYDYIKKVKKVILIAVPNKGSPAAELYQNLFNNLINLESAYNLFNPNSIVLEQLTNGLITPRVPTIGYYVIAGTKTYDYNAIFFRITTAKLFKRYEPNDGMVTVSSAQYVGDDYINDKCNNYWEIEETHTGLLDEFISRNVVERIIAQEISEEAEKERIPILGHYKYFNMLVRECSPDEVYIVIGKKVKKEKTVDPTGCLCGNGYCGEGEDKFNCPSDCLNIFRKENIALSLPYIFGVLLSLLMFFLYKKVKGFHNMLHYPVGKVIDILKNFKIPKLTKKEKTEEEKDIEKREEAIKVKLEKIEEAYEEEIEEKKGKGKLKEKLNNIKSKILKFLRIEGEPVDVKEEKKTEVKPKIEKYADVEIPEEEEFVREGIFRKLLSKIKSKLRREEAEEEVVEEEPREIKIPKFLKVFKLFKKKKVEEEFDEEAEEEFDVRSPLLTLYSLLIFVGISVIIISLIFTKLLGIFIGILIIIFSIAGYKTSKRVYEEKPPEI